LCYPQSKEYYFFFKINFDPGLRIFFPPLSKPTIKPHVFSRNSEPGILFPIKAWFFSFYCCKTISDSVANGKTSISCWSKYFLNATTSISEPMTQISSPGKSLSFLTRIFIVISPRLMKAIKAIMGEKKN